MSRQGEHRTPTRTNIEAFWNAEAAQLGESPQVTIRDHYFRLHELHTILPVIPHNSRLMDVGCGTGFGTMVLARRTGYTLGVDYSQKMIDWARLLATNCEYRKKLSGQYSFLWELVDPKITDTQIQFDVGNVLNFKPAQEKSFDVITGQRILINLPAHEDQMDALRNLRRLIAPNGILILTEATKQGHERTDVYRNQFGLPILEKYWHNNYVDENRLDEWVSAGWEVEYNLGFETYALLSKVVYPASCGPDNCSFLSGANAAAMEMACLFRAEPSYQEIGKAAFFRMYVERIKRYDLPVGERIENWLVDNLDRLASWKLLGHQRMFIARPV